MNIKIRFAVYIERDIGNDISHIFKVQSISDR